MPFSIKLSYAGTPAGTITYNAGTDTITVIGANSTHPAEFLDLYNADVAGGWGQVLLQGTKQFVFSCKIIFGDGTNDTYFSDTGFQVTFDSSVITASYQIAIKLVNKAYFTVGEVVIEGDKTTAYGGSFLFLCTSYLGYFIKGDSGSRVYLYSSHFYDTRSPADTGGLITLGGIGNRIWNCLFARNFVLFQGVGGDLFNSVFQKSLYCINPISGTSWTVNKLVTTDGDHALRLSADINITNFYSRNYIDAAEFYVANTTLRFINADIDNWSFGWFSEAYSSIAYRQYSFDLYVLNGAITDFVENANVTLIHDGATYGSWLTNSTGQIATQTLTYGFYNYTGGDTMYGGTAWTLTITHPDWETYTSAFYPYSEIDWSISMQDTSTSNNNMLLVGLLVGSLAFLGLVVIRRKM